MMKEDGRDLLAEFQALAPEREPMKIQRWSVRRILSRSGWCSWRSSCSLLVSNWTVFA